MASQQFCVRVCVCVCVFVFDLTSIISISIIYYYDYYLCMGNHLSFLEFLTVIMKNGTTSLQCVTDTSVPVGSTLDAVTHLVVHHRKLMINK